MEYSVIIHKDEKSGWYTGKCVQVPGAMSQGRTLDELIENMNDAINEICKELGIPYPGKTEVCGNSYAALHRLRSVLPLLRGWSDGAKVEKKMVLFR